MARNLLIQSWVPLTFLKGSRFVLCFTDPGSSEMSRPISYTDSTGSQSAIWTITPNNTIIATYQNQHLKAMVVTAPRNPGPRTIALVLNANQYRTRIESLGFTCTIDCLLFQAL
ncbi:hypothetical protein FRB93_005392 [Tulasnella sp. JGI-2019a]|nr:hypothetical protein FRB93_005392 [Tulasnella sp. JGI-2019a]